MSRIIRCAVLAAAVVAGVAGVAATAGAAGQRAGSAFIVDAGSGRRLLHDGGSSTQFRLQLPEDATCPGDSTNDNYRVQTFLVPEGNEPALLQYISVHPVGKGLYALYDTTTDPVVDRLTADRTAPGKPGRIENLPAFSFAVFTNGELHSGTYHVGVACTLFNDTVRYWSNDIQLTTGVASDRPAHLRWRAVGVGTSTSSGRSVAPLLVSLAVAAVLIAIAVVRRRRSPHHSISREHR